MTSIKISFKDDLRRVKAPESYEKLLEITKTLFTKRIPAKIRFHYIDIDGDVISITSDSDYQEALASTANDGKILKLEVSESLDNTVKESKIAEITRIAEPIKETNESESLKSMFPDKNLHSFMDDFDIVDKTEEEKVPIVIKEEENVPNVVIEEEKIPIINKEVVEDPIQVVEDPIVVEEESTIGTQTKKIESENKECNTVFELNNMANEDKKCFAGVKSIEMVRSMIKKELNFILPFLMKEYIEKKSAKKEEEYTKVHQNVTCDDCGTNNIVGIRYKCIVCKDYDLCQDCEKKDVHNHHAFIKLKDPNQKLTYLCATVKDSEENKPKNGLHDKLADVIKYFQDGFLNQKPDENKYVSKAVKIPFYPWGAKTNMQYCHSNDASDIPTEPLKARFVKEFPAELMKVCPGEKVEKTWTFRNDGNTSWPKTTKFVSAGGDCLETEDVKVPSVIPGETYDIKLTLTAPLTTGRYTAYFRMFDGKKRFGHRVWAEMLVVEPVKEEIRAEEGSSLLHKAKSQEEKEDGLTDGLLDRLEELGLTNREMNKMLLAKYKDLDVVVNKIFNGDLEQSAFNA